ncbi:MAG: DMT family transporter [Spirulina sp.]
MMTHRLIRFPKSSFLANPKIKAIAALAIALIVWAFVPILVRIAENEITPNAVAFHRLWIASAILGLGKGMQTMTSQLFSLNHQSNSAPSFSGKTVGLLLATSIFFAANHIAWIWSLTQTSIANSALLHNFTPVFVILAGFLLFAQRFDRRFIMGAIVAVGGSIVLGFDDISYGMVKVQGDAIAFLSAFFFALYLLFVERIRDRFDTMTTIFYCCSLGMLAILPTLFENAGKIFPSSGSGWLVLLGLGCSIVLCYGLTVYALKFLSSGLVSIILLLDSVFTAILAWIIFSETLDPYNILAFPLILLGIYLAIASQSPLDRD